ncbi:MAG: S1 RNA-binding domain-containing protein, partial [Thermoanaerobaculia bacterium]|nr:S1 RNA-binding domain-containing protein [Thermoanaerobaculia bacterium]
FGAFVDLGVKRDGLVHLSELSDGWVDDPRTIVRAGQIVKVRVLEVDHERQRISLSMKSEASAPRNVQRTSTPRNRPQAQSTSQKATLEDLARKFNRR